MIIKTIRGLLIFAIVLAWGGKVSSAVPDSAHVSGDATVLEEKKQPAVSPGNGAEDQKIAKLTKVTTRKNKDEVAITIEVDGSIQYTAFKLQNPLRLVMDFQKTQKGVLEDRLDVRLGVVESIRPTYFTEAEVLRLEIALTQPTQYEIIRAENNKLIINLRESPKEDMQISEKKMRTLVNLFSSLLTRLNYICIPLLKEN